VDVPRASPDQNRPLVRPFGMITLMITRPTILQQKALSLFSVAL
jgi:hypothetical protein